MNVLNKDYASTGVSWSLASTSRTVNGDWYSKADYGSAQQTAMKKALRKGGAGDLNVYTVGKTTAEGVGDLLGYATFPFDYAKNPNDDGVVILAGSLPGGSISPFNLGKTLTHEAGHWVGLYHTFQGGCGALGDSVNDTNPEAEASSGCPIGKSTCPGGKLDPILLVLIVSLKDNFMDYSDDYCLDNFTPGQA
ncbi:hypothetical protein H0H93_016275, partial [Arthromyces matolae]